MLTDRNANLELGLRKFIYSYFYYVVRYNDIRKIGHEAHRSR